MSWPDEKVDLEPTGIILVFVDLRIFALMEGGKINWEVILPSNGMRGEITE